MARRGLCRLFGMASIPYDLAVTLELQALIDANSQLEKDMKC
jgi:hypothetical protein